MFNSMTTEQEKETQLELIEESKKLDMLPADWKIIKLEEAAQYINGYPFKPSDWKGNGLPIIRIQNLNDASKPYNFFDEQIPDKYQVRYGDILISWSASLGAYRWDGEDAWLNQHIFKAIVKPNIIDRDFFYWAMKNIIEHLVALSNGSTMRHIVLKTFLNAQIPLPPGPEQRAIAHVLQTTQQAIQTRRKELELERERKTALIQHLFTHGLRNEQTRQNEVGEIPVSWKVVQLGKLLSDPLKNGYSARESNSTSGIRTLVLTAVTRNDFSIKNTKVTVAEPQKVKDLWLRSGDIFIERGNTFEFVGLAALYQGPEDFAIYPDLLIRVRLQKNCIIPQFAIEFLLSDVCRSYFRKNAAGTAGNMPKIDHGTVERTPILLPTLSEQQEIAQIFQFCNSKIAALEKEITLHEELFRALLDELMTGRISTLPLVEELEKGILTHGQRTPDGTGTTD